MKVLTVGDLHGRWEFAQKAADKFRQEEYDKLVFLGDYVDSYDRSDAEMLLTLRLVTDIKNEFGDRVELLLGNHDIQYLYGEQFRCSGYRPGMYYPILEIMSAYKDKFHVAYGYKNYLWTHAGLQKPWYQKHFETLSKWADIVRLDITDVEDMAGILNVVSQTRDMPILHEVGIDRGGYPGNFGGITWADKQELGENGVLPGLHQIVGHTKQSFINRLEEFEGGSKYNNTSVTFVDVLGSTGKFLTTEIN